MFKKIAPVFLLLINRTIFVESFSVEDQQVRSNKVQRSYNTEKVPRIKPLVERYGKSSDEDELIDYLDTIIGERSPKRKPDDTAHVKVVAVTSTQTVATSTVQSELNKGTTTKANENSRGDADASSDTEIIKRLLTKGYDWRVRPPGVNLTINGSHGPVIVAVNMLIRSISKIDDVNMEYSVQLTFRENWVDGRLAYGLPGDNLPDFIILTAGQQIWMPDSFFQNEKQAQKHMIDKPNVLIRIHKDGRILYSVRISMVLSCPMHLQYYPMDVQTCLIDLASYAYTTEDIEYVWKDKDPVQLKEGLNSSLPSFQLNNVSTTYCTSRTNTGTYSCLRTVLELKRQFSYYLLQLYIPSTMLVIVSWVSFWLDRSAVPARVTLGVTTLLTMTTQSSGINAKLPPVSYTKAIDIWIGACLTFIFGALLEFAWVTYISSRNFHKGSRSEAKRSYQHKPVIIQNNAVDIRAQTQPEGEVWIKQNVGTEATELLLLRPRRQPRVSSIRRVLCGFRFLQWLKERKDKLDVEDPAKQADLISRALFPLTFLVFNLAYWFNYSRYHAPR